MILVIGNKNYSSWSMRPWLALKQTGLEFEEILVPLSRPDTRKRLLEHSPSAKVPVLKHGSVLIWDSLAICEYLAELCPQAGLWPEDRASRALARSIVAEMHSSFSPLRRHMPMDCRSSLPGKGREPGVNENVGRITEIWTDCLKQHARKGIFLFGSFSLADAFFAPVVSRFLTYDVRVGDLASDYMAAIWKHQHVREWVEAAREEPWTIEH
jgi:glutathione S-transferase